MKTVRANATTKHLKDLGISILLILFIWQVIVWLINVSPYILPGPMRVIETFAYNAELISQHTLVAAIEVLIGLVMGTVLAAATTFYLMMSNTARRFVMPILVLSQTMPVFALAPMLAL